MNVSTPEKPKRQRALSEFGFTRISGSRKSSTVSPVTATRRFQGYQLTLHQLVARKFGRKVYRHKDVSTSKGFAKSAFYDRWRMPQVKHKFGGSGYDEMTRTALARDTMDVIDKRARELHKDAENFAALFSQDRANTDALVWFKGAELGGHPGALRSQPTGNNPVVHGHGSRDTARARATRTEFQELIPKPSKSGLSDLMGAAHHMAARSQVETLRTMALPFEEFQALGPPKSSVYHARYGDVSDPGNYTKMARYVHHERERLKWDTGRKLMGLGLDQHVPEVMQEYINKFKGDHTQAFTAYHEALANNTEHRVNTATTTQAEALDSRTETLKSTAGRKRALSLPRALPK